MAETGNNFEYPTYVKTPEDLKSQVRTASDVLGIDLNLPSKNGSVYELNPDELKEKYPVRYAAYVAALRAFMSGQEIPLDQREAVGKTLTMLNNLDSYITRHQTGEESTLRDRQFNVFEDTREFMEKGGKAGYLKLPTGFGKTVLFTELVEAMDVPTLIVVPTKILIDNTESKIHEFAPDLKNDLGKVYGEAKGFNKKVTLTTYDSLQIR